MWALVCIVCLILELTNGDFFIMCFAIGAICSAVLSAFGLPFYAGLAVFAVTSVLSLLFIRPTMMKKLHPRESLRRSNADALIGRKAKASHIAFYINAVNLSKTTPADTQCLPAIRHCPAPTHLPRNGFSAR